jgi:hypothetical protein
VWAKTALLDYVAAKAKTDLQIAHLEGIESEVELGLEEGGHPDPFGLATLGLLAHRAAQRPLLCIVDYAHWLDRESADVLACVARRLDADAIGMVFALREPAPSYR